MNEQPNFVYFEDDALSRRVMEVLLTRGAGYKRLTMFENSADPVERLGQLDTLPDVIFMDIHMEPLTGFEVLDLLRADERYRSVKVIALTASVMNEEVDMLKEAGFDGGIAKPIDAASFIPALQQILAGEEIWLIA